MFLAWQYLLQLIHQAITIYRMPHQNTLRSLIAELMDSVSEGTSMANAIKDGRRRIFVGSAIVTLSQQHLMTDNPFPRLPHSLKKGGKVTQALLQLNVNE